MAHALGDADGVDGVPLEEHQPAVSALAQAFYASRFFRRLRLETRDYRQHPVLGGISSTRWHAYDRFTAKQSFLVDQLKDRDPFDQVIGLIQGEQRMTQNELNRPFSILSVDSQGNFSTFDPELLSVASDRYGTFNLGNLRDVSLVESTRTDQFKRLLSDMSRGVDSCQKTCEYFGLCGGGNGSNKFWEHGTLASSETNACRFGTQIPVQVLLERFEAGPPLTPQPTH